MYFLSYKCSTSLNRNQGAVSSPETSPNKAGSSRSGMFNKVHSPVTKIQTTGGRALSSSERGQSLCLSYHPSLRIVHSVPIYDARSISFDFAEHLPAYARILPVFDGEVPIRSLATVLYSANSFRRKPGQDGQVSTGRQLSLNIQAVIVLATPSPLE